VTLVILSALAGVLSQEGYSRIAEQHGVTVYKKTRGQQIDLAAEGDLPAPPDRVLEVLTDYENHPRWVKSLTESKVLWRGKSAADIYQRISAPLVADRDFTLHATWGREGEEHVVRLRARNERGPAPKDGVVRVNVNEGEWRLTPNADGKSTHVVYRFRLDLGGKIPGNMASDQAAKDLPGLFDGMRSQLGAQ
jgi:uncharacterized protein YndB with AHSA1/START domain